MISILIDFLFRMNSNYLKHIEEIWDIKEEIYNDTKNMDNKEFYNYVNENIKNIRERFKNKFLVNK